MALLFEVRQKASHGRTRPASGHRRIEVAAHSLFQRNAAALGVVNTLFFGTPARGKGIRCATPPTTAAESPLTFQVAKHVEPPSRNGGKSVRARDDVAME